MPYASHARHFAEERLPALVDGWFDAAAAVHRAAPWDLGIDPRRPLFATLGSQGMEDAALHPLGPEGGPPGFALLAGPDDLEAWLALEAAGGAPRGAPGFFRLELTFGPAADAHPDVRSELERGDRGLGDAVPSVWRVDDGGAVHPGNVDDLMIVEAVTAALGAALEAPPGDDGLLEPWRAGEMATRTVEAGAAGIEVVLSTRPLAAEMSLPAGDLIDALRELEERDDGWLADGPGRHVIEHRLGRRFLHSPEAAGLADGAGEWQTLARWAASHLGRTIATLDADGVEEVVFDLVPRKLSADPDFARPFVECLRAFYRWLGREYALPQADECLRTLETPDAIERLEGLMADDANFDPAKAMVMAARAEGIDPATPGGAARMQAWMNERLGAPGAPAGLDWRDPWDDAPRARPPLDPEAKRKRDAKRKAGRKAARKARKRNR